MVGLISCCNVSGLRVLSANGNCLQALAFTLWKKSQFNDAVKLFHEIEDIFQMGDKLHGTRSRTKRLRVQRALN